MSEFAFIKDGFTHRCHPSQAINLYYKQIEITSTLNLEIMTTTFEATVKAPAASKGRTWTARIMAGLVIAFMLMDSIFKFIPNDQVIEGTEQLGYQAHHIPIMGTLGLLSILLF